MTPNLVARVIAVHTSILVLLLPTSGEARDPTPQLTCVESEGRLPAFASLRRGSPERSAQRRQPALRRLKVAPTTVNASEFRAGLRDSGFLGPSLIQAVGPVCQPPTDDERHSQDVTLGRPEKGMFDEGSLGIEFGGAVLPEAWNLNDRREWLLDGSGSVWWAFTRRLTLVVEFHATQVFQTSSRNAFVNGLVPLVRWRLFNMPPGSLFVEIGPGISWSDTRVPPRGTQFNYMIQGGVGLARRLRGRTQAVMGFRWLHISNAGREGRSNNPDIEALGGYGGLSVAF
jgi:Lipid A 3-O-deacylase (PagL)